MQYFVLVCITLGSKTWSCGYSQIYHVKWRRYYGKIGEYCIYINVILNLSHEHWRTGIAVLFSMDDVRVYFICYYLNLTSAIMKEKNYPIVALVYLE